MKISTQIQMGKSTMLEKIFKMMTITTIMVKTFKLKMSSRINSFTRIMVNTMMIKENLTIMSMLTIQITVRMMTYNKVLLRQNPINSNKTKMCSYKGENRVLNKGGLFLKSRISSFSSSHNSSIKTSFPNNSSKIK